MKKQGWKYGAVLMVTLAFVLSASLALAGPGGWGGGMGPGYGKWGNGGGMGGGYPYTASLTPEQSQAFQTLRQAYLRRSPPFKPSSSPRRAN